MPSTDPRLTSPAWRRLRLAVLDRDGWVCQVKGPDCTTVATTVDHVIPRCDGGEFWNPRNLRGACRRCNMAAGADVTNARRAARYGTTEARFATRM